MWMRVVDGIRDRGIPGIRALARVATHPPFPITF